MQEPLEAAIDANCDVIICACRSYGDTQKVINRICNSYDKVWITKNELDSDSNQNDLRDRANEHSAHLILEIVQNL